MKKEAIYTLLAMVLVGCFAAVGLAGVAMTDTVTTAASANATGKTFDLRPATGEAHITFSLYSTKGIVRGQVGANTALVNLTTVTATTNSTHRYVTRAPYRYIFVRYTSTGVSSHTMQTSVFTY